MADRTLNSLYMRRKMLREELCKLGPFLRGSIVEYKRICDKPHCRCQRGYLPNKNGVELTAAELALMFSYNRTRIGQFIAQYEKDHNCILPDEVQFMMWEEALLIRSKYVARSYLRGKETPDIAKECSHDL